MATVYAPNFSLLVSNTAGNVQQLPDERVGGKVRIWMDRVTMNGNAIGEQIAVARLPYGAVPLDLFYSADTSVGVSTIAAGDKNNISRFATAGTYTVTTIQTTKLLPTALGVPLTTAYDYAGVSNTNYEDVLLTVGVSSLPSAGTLTVVIEYLDYGS